MRELSRILNVALCLEVWEGIEPYMLNVALCLEVSDGIELYAKCSFLFRSQ